MRKFEVEVECEFVRTMRGYITVYAEDMDDARRKVDDGVTGDWMEQHFVGEGSPGEVRINSLTEVTND